MIIFNKQYDGESICDVQRDIIEAFDSRFNPLVKDIPQNEDGFPLGTFVVTVTYKEESI